MMKKAEALELTERLRGLVDLGPGNNAIILGKARRALATLQDAGFGPDVGGQCIELRGIFEQWFSVEPWARRREGDNVQRHLHRQIAELETCIDEWYCTDDRPRIPYDEQAD